MPPLPPNTRVQIGTAEGIETARVMRWRKSMGGLPGFVPVRFDSDGAELMVHRDGLMVCDERSAA